MISGDWACVRARLETLVTPTGGTAREMAGYASPVFRHGENGVCCLCRDANLKGLEKAGILVVKSKLLRAVCCWQNVDRVIGCRSTMQRPVTP